MANTILTTVCRTEKYGSGSCRVCSLLDREKAQHVSAYVCFHIYIYIYMYIYIYINKYLNLENIHEVCNNPDFQRVVCNLGC